MCCNSINTQFSVCYTPTIRWVNQKAISDFNMYTTKYKIQNAIDRSLWRCVYYIYTHTHTLLYVHVYWDTNILWTISETHWKTLWIEFTIHVFFFCSLVFVATTRKSISIVLCVLCTLAIAKYNDIAMYRV